MKRYIVAAYYHCAPAGVSFLMQNKDNNSSKKKWKEIRERESQSFFDL